jgi:hypothetical protein
MNHQHVLEIADLGSVKVLTDQLIRLMESQAVGKTFSARRAKWLEIASIAESRAQTIGKASPAPPPLHQIDSDPGQSPVFES